MKNLLFAAITICGLLTTPASLFAQERAKPSVANATPVTDFSGEWLRDDKFEYESRTLLRVDQVFLFQQGNRVCGCMYVTSGIQGKTYFNMIVGRVEENVLDFITDVGDRRSLPDEYKPSYPIEPYLYRRYKRQGTKLLRGDLGFNDLALVVLKNLSAPDQTRYNEVASLDLRPNKLEDSACGYLNVDWRKFFEACFADTNPNPLKGILK